jgi:transcriptional regulator with XRE-family HTH domain
VPSRPGKTARRVSGTEGADGHVRALGRLMRDARRNRYTVEQLASHAGVSAGLISQIERGQGNPSLSTILKLVHALNLPLGAFFEGKPSRNPVVHKRDRMKLHLPHEGHEGLIYELLSPDFKHSLAMFRAMIPSGWDNQEHAFIHEGEESVHMLSGRVDVHVGDKLFRLKAGDTVMYDSGLPHWWRNSSKAVAETITAITRPGLW